MIIYYISLGSFCYPKMIIRETNREISESLPFDFNSSPHLNGITNILKDLHKNKTYEIELIEILQIFNENELTVREKNMYLVHFFKTFDLKNKIEEFPINVDIIKEDVINDVKNKFRKRFQRLYEILNNNEHIICFLRIENYDNYGWNNELEEFTKILAQFKNPNKYLIYTQNLIDDNLHFPNSNVLNYNYHIPILFYKHYFYDLEMIHNKDLFISLLNTFENILNSKNILHIKNNTIIEKYYIDTTKNTIFKLSNMKHFANYYMENDILYINNVINGYEKYVKKDNYYINII